jgi:hypothetical protein
MSDAALVMAASKMVVGVTVIPLFEKKQWCDEDLQKENDPMGRRACIGAVMSTG